MASEVSQIVPCDILTGIRKADDGDLAKSGKPRVQGFPCEADPLQRSRPLRCQQEVSFRELVEQESRARRRFEITRGDRDALGEMAVPTRIHGLQRIALGWLDLRDAGSEIPQPLHRHRSWNIQRE